MRTLYLDVGTADSYPLTLEVVKLDLRIEHDDLDNLLLRQYIPAATTWAERYMRRSIMQRTHRWALDELPEWELYLPRGKVQSVTSIVYQSDGAPLTLRGPSSGSPAGTDWQEDLSDPSPVIMPPRGGSWPSADVDVPAPVVVTFVAGWTTASEVPGEIKQGLLAWIAGALDSRLDEDMAGAVLSGWRILA